MKRLHLNHPYITYMRGVFKLKKISNIFVVLLTLVLGISLYPISIFAMNDLNLNDLHLKGEGADISDHLSHIKEFNQGSLTLRFRSESLSSDLTSLFSISNANLENNYFALYYQNSTGKLGIEFRDETGKHIINTSGTSTQLANANWHTVTVLNHGNRVEIYADGILLASQDNIDFTKIQSLPWNRMKLGGVARLKGDNLWPFSGKIASLNLTHDILDVDTIKTLHNDTASTVDPSTSEAIELYAPGQDGSKNYRIPSLLTTQDGTVLAAIDKRITHQADWGNIDIAIRRSLDSGKTWSDTEVIIDLKSDPNVSQENVNTNYQSSAFLIDAAMAQDNRNGRIYLLVDMFPESRGFFSVQNEDQDFGQPYVTKEDGTHIVLKGTDGKKYYAKADGTVFDLNTDIITNYRVVLESEKGMPFNDLGDLYEGDTYVGNIYLKKSPLRIRQTAYLWLTHSDDDGQTWSSPHDITPQVKADWMQFIGTGPGVGIQLKNGELAFPIYHTNRHGGNSQSTSMIKSADGITWHKTESLNDNRNFNGQVLNSKTLNNGGALVTESQVVQLNNGTLKQFARNVSGKVLVGTSYDNGETWENDLETLPITDVYSQMSALHYNHEGKEYILLANPNGPKRTNGAVKLLQVLEGERLVLLSNTHMQSGNYEYNVVQPLPDGHFGLMYEHKKPENGDNMSMMFKRFSFEDLGVKDTSSLSLDIQDTYLEIKSDKALIPSSNLTLTYNTTQTTKPKRVDTNTLRFNLAEPVTILNGFTEGYLETLDGKALNIANKQGLDEALETLKALDFENLAPSVKDAADQLITKAELLSDNPFTIGDFIQQIHAMIDAIDPTYIPNSMFDVTASSQEDEKGNTQVEGPIGLAFDGDPSTFWHSKWGDKNPPFDVTVSFHHEMVVNALTYLPRQDGTLNGVVTEYQILGKLGDAPLHVLTEGTLDTNLTKKIITFEDAHVDTLIFKVVKGLENYGNAAEITLHGKTYRAPLDYSSLNQVLETLESYNQSLYTEASFKPLLELKEKAYELLDNSETTQEMIDEMVINLNEFINNLELSNYTLDSLRLKIKEVEDYMNTLDLSLYTQTSVQAVYDALDSAKALLQTPRFSFRSLFKASTPNEAQIKEAIESLDSAVRGLSKREVETEEPSNPDENITPPIVDPKPDTDSQKPETPDSNTEDSAQISPTDKTDVTLPKTGQAVSGFIGLGMLVSLCGFVIFKRKQ